MKYGHGLSKWADAIVGGWQTTFQMFAKSGTAFTPYWTCDNCGNGDAHGRSGKYRFRID